MKKIVIIAPLVLLSVCGCIVGDAVEGAVNVATLPVKAGAKVVDLATTSEKEKDAKFLREMRKRCEAWEKERKGDPELPPPNDYCLTDD